MRGPAIALWMLSLRPAVAADPLAAAFEQAVRALARGDLRAAEQGFQRVLTGISVLNIWVELCKVLRRLYSCGFQRSRDVQEA